VINYGVRVIQLIPSQWWSVLTPLVAFAGLFAGIEFGRPSWLAPPSASAASAVLRAFAAKPRMASPRTVAVPVPDPVIGFVDMRDGKPIIFAKKGSVVDVSGWTACAVPGSTISSVILSTDGTRRAEVKEFLPRPDVAEAFGRPEFQLSGWRARVPLAGLNVGEYALTAQGVCSNGEKGVVPAFRMSIFE